MTDRFQFPLGPSADWHTFSAPLCVEADGTLGLPDEQDRLLLHALLHQQHRHDRRAERAREGRGALRVCAPAAHRPPGAPRD